MKADTDYLNSVQNLFSYYKLLGDKAMAQLPTGLWFVSLNEDSNSIAVIVNHLSGNMLSRWTDFLTTDGEKPWRNRDLEFENVLETPEQVTQAWENGWACLFGALDSLSGDHLNQIVYIRNEGHSVMEAINRQLAHYAYHVGQIVFEAKLLKAGSWDSLSIPRRGSGAYNEDKFSKMPSVGDFTRAEKDRLNGL